MKYDLQRSHVFFQVGGKKSGFLLSSMFLWPSCDKLDQSWHGCVPLASECLCDECCLWYVLCVKGYDWDSVCECVCLFVIVGENTAAWRSPCVEVCWVAGLFFFFLFFFSFHFFRVLVLEELCGWNIFLCNYEITRSLSTHYFVLKMSGSFLHLKTTLNTK